MTPEQRAAGVCVAVREHGLFNHVTDERWMRYIEAAIKSALDDALPDANDLDEVVHALGIEDSHITPTEAVKAIRDHLFALQAATADLLKTTPEERQDPAIWFSRVDAARAALNWVYYSPSDALSAREPGTCKCGAAPINKDGMCATCADEQRPRQWVAFKNVSYPHLWGIETTDPRAVDAGLDILIAPCMPEHAAKTLADEYNKKGCGDAVGSPLPRAESGDK